MKQLRISPELAMPIEAVTKKFGFFGQNGSGKTYGAMKLAELMLDAGGQIVVIDPVGKWYGLRLAENGKSPSGIEIPVFGGLHGDIPLESTAGELVADVVVDRGISAVLDVSQFDYDAERTRFIEHFARRIFNRKKAAPSAIHIFVEEAQEFLPMQPNAGEEKMLREVLRLGKIGRNHGFGWTLITPRPQEITTKARNLSEVVFAFQTNGTHERKAIAEWVKEKGQDLDVVDLLPKLKPGFAHAWSPSWLEFSGTIHIAKKRTFDASATPEVGAKAVEAKPLGSIDLEQLKKTMAATIEKAKADDPKELRKEIAKLKGEIAKTAKGKAAPDPAVLEARIKQAVTDALLVEWKRTKEALRFIAAATTMVDDVGKRLDLVREQLAGAHAFLHKDIPPAPASAASPTRHASRVATTPVVPARTQGTAVSTRALGVRNDAHGTPSSNGHVSGVEQRILDTLRGLEDLGIAPADKDTVAALVGYHPNAKSYSNALGASRSAGRVEYPQPGTLALTDDGRARAESKLHVSTVEELHEVWYQKLGNVAKRILVPLIAAYPEACDASAIAEAAGYHPNAKSFSNMKGRLRTLGLISYPAPGMMAATDILFPEGLT